MRLKEIEIGIGTAESELRIWDLGYSSVASLSSSTVTPTTATIFLDSFLFLGLHGDSWKLTLSEVGIDAVFFFPFLRLDLSVCDPLFHFGDLGFALVLRFGIGPISFVVLLDMAICSRFILYVVSFEMETRLLETVIRVFTFLFFLGSETLITGFLFDSSVEIMGNYVEEFCRSQVI